MPDVAETDVAIIGGGVIGIACAYYLAGAGRSVRVLERGKVGSGASRANCGLVTPSHAAPLTLPGMPSKALRMMLDPGSPFHINARIGLADLPWFVRMARACGSAAAGRSMRARAALLNSSRALYDELLRGEGLQCRWETVGLLEVYRDPAVRTAQQRLAEALTEVGVRSVDLDGEQARRREPALREEVCGARWFQDDAHLRPDLLAAEWARVVRARGADIVEDCAVEAARIEGGRVLELATSKGPVRSRHVVVAAGAWSPRLSDILGIAIRVRPGKGYSITMRRPDVCPALPLLLKERSVAVTPWSDGFRLGGTMQFAGYDDRLEPRRLAAIREGAGRYLLTTFGEAEGEFAEWTGWRPMSPDEVPFIGPSPRHRNLLLATGHGMLGVSMATGTGKLVSELICERPPHVDPAFYDPARL